MNNTPSNPIKKRGRPSKTKESPTKTESPVSTQRGRRSLRKSVEVQEESSVRSIRSRSNKSLNDTSISEKVPNEDKSPVPLKKKAKVVELSETSIDETIELMVNEECESTSVTLPETQHSDAELATEAIIVEQELANDCEKEQMEVESTQNNDANVETPTTSSNIQTTINQTIEQTSTNSIDLDEEFPILLSKEVKEIEAGSILIETKYRGNESTSIVLYINGNKHQESKRIKTEIVQDKNDENVYSVCVKISEANLSDSGNYCVLLVGDYKRIILDYNIKIDPKFERCWLTNNAECIRMPNGAVRLKFGIRSLSKFTAKWFHNGVELEEQTRQMIDKKPNNRYQVCLVLPKASTKENEGTYLCEVKSEHNTLQATFNIELEDKKPTFVKEPSISLESTDGNSTLILSVEYKADNEIKTSVLWKGKADEFVDEKNLKLYKVVTKTDKTTGVSTTQLKLKGYKSSEHSGIYLCEISNESGTLVAELDVANDDEAKENGNSC